MRKGVREGMEIDGIWMVATTPVVMARVETKASSYGVVWNVSKTRQRSRKRLKMRTSSRKISVTIKNVS